MKTLIIILLCTLCQISNACSIDTAQYSWLFFKSEQFKFRTLNVNITANNSVYDKGQLIGKFVNDRLYDCTGNLIVIKRGDTMYRANGVIIYKFSNNVVYDMYGHVAYRIVNNRTYNSNTVFYGDFY